MNSTVFIIYFIFIVGSSAGSVKKSQDENHSDGKNVTFLNDEMTEVMKLCNESFPTPLNYLKTLNETGRFPPEAKQESKCYVYCVLEQLEIINEHGEVQNNSADELFAKDSDQKEVRDAVVKCIDSQKKDEKDVCEKAYQFVSCLMMEEISRHKKN